MNRFEESPISCHVAPVTALSSQQWQAIVDLCTAAYDEDFNDIFAALPGTVHVLGYHAGVLVSHAAWVTRWLQPAGLNPLRTAYIEAVATDPAHQGRGYASAVMRHLAGQLDDYDLYDLAGLSPSDPAFYARLGWELWRGPLAIRTADGLLETPDEQVMVLRLPRTPPLDLEGLLTAEWRMGELW
jgi:aminoglycoside 2'-N-acetyltransferase I